MELRNYLPAMVLPFMLMFPACSDKETREVVNFTEADFGRTVQISAEHCFPDVELARPGVLCCHPDGYLLVSDVLQPKMLQVVDLNSKSVCGSLITKGRSSSELLGVASISLDGKDVIVAGTMDNKILRLRRSDSGGMEVYESVTASRQYLRAVAFGGNYLTVASASSRNTMELLDGKGAVVDTLGSFPDLGFEKDAYSTSLLQSAIAVSPDKKHIALVNLPVDYMDIYDADGNLSARLRGPDLDEYSYKVSDMGIGKMYSFKPMKAAYMGVAATNKGFYAGRVGVWRETREDFAKGISSVYFFDWSGKPKIRYVLDTELVTFTVDAEGRILYGLRNTDSGTELVRFVL